MEIADFHVETATVRCEPSRREITVVLDSTLLDAIHQVGLPLGQSCDGGALCGFCRVKVVEGLQNLTPMAAEENRILRSLHARPDERLACCACITGPVTVTTDYW